MELRVAGNDPSARFPIKAELPDVSQEGATRCPEDYDWISPGRDEADDCKSLQDYSEDCSIGGWGLCTEGEFPRASDQVNPGYQYTNSRDPATLKLSKKADYGGITLQGGNAGLSRTKVRDGFYSAQAGCSREADKTLDGAEVYSCNLCQIQCKEKKSQDAY